LRRSGHAGPSATAIRSSVSQWLIEP
jgi:hypothetical protein